MLALHGIRVIVIGLDIQGSITKTMLTTSQHGHAPDILAYNKAIKGLYHFFNQPEKSRRIEEVIHKTDLPTLDIIPETPQLNDLILLINQKTLREFRFRDELLPHLEAYDVVLFDNGPSWNSLVENSLASSNTLIQPVGCDVGTFQVLDGNMAQIEDFRVKAKITWDQPITGPYSSGKHQALPANPRCLYRSISCTPASHEFDSKECRRPRGTLSESIGTGT